MEHAAQKGPLRVRDRPPVEADGIQCAPETRTRAAASRRLMAHLTVLMSDHEFGCTRVGHSSRGEYT